MSPLLFLGFSFLLVALILGAYLVLDSPRAHDPVDRIDVGFLLLGIAWGMVGGYILGVAS